MQITYKTMGNRGKELAKQAECKKKIVHGKMAEVINLRAISLSKLVN